MLVEVLLAKQPVAAHSKAVVGRVHHDRVLGVRALPQLPEDSPDLTIKVTDEPVVLRQLVLDYLSRARPRAEALVPAGHVTVVEGVLGSEVRRKGRRIPIVRAPIPRRRIARIVRSREGDVSEKWSRVTVVAEEIDSGIGEQRAREANAVPRGSQSPVRPEVPDRHFHVV